LGELAEITLDTGASFIYREARERYIPVKFSVRGRDLGAIHNSAGPFGGFRNDIDGEMDSFSSLPDPVIHWAARFDEVCGRNHAA
jgi:hypothetical protein